MAEIMRLPIINIDKCDLIFSDVIIEASGENGIVCSASYARKRVYEMEEKILKSMTSEAQVSFRGFLLLPKRIGYMVQQTTDGNYRVTVQTR